MCAPEAREDCESWSHTRRSILPNSDQSLHASGKLRYNGNLQLWFVAVVVVPAVVPILLFPVDSKALRDMDCRKASSRSLVVFKVVVAFWFRPHGGRQDKIDAGGLIKSWRKLAQPTWCQRTCQVSATIAFLQACCGGLSPCSCCTSNFGFGRAWRTGRSSGPRGIYIYIYIYPRNISRDSRVFRYPIGTVDARSCVPVAKNKK